MDNVPDKTTIEKAYERVNTIVNRTPVFTNNTFNEMFGVEAFFKCENLQKVGAFKFRGACNTVMQLTDKQAANGVVTHSSGNHAAALSLAAKKRGIPAYIVMPETAPKVKIESVKNYGGQITFCKPTLEARVTTADRIIEETGGILIHPYDDYRIIAGAATAALELFEEVEGMDYLLAPIGGGGLISGSALSAHYFSPGTKTVACEPENADDAFLSFQKGEIVTINNPNTIADGLRTMLSDKTFDVVQRFVDRIVTVSEEEIICSMRFVWERMKLIIEPSSAVPVAAVMFNKIDFTGSRVGIILSGGNVDLATLPFS
ncbi:MAG: pyridoxal-phosphate dependent enzyme [bacterium]|nr:pyridoxal-phosphate dependent enzyme [bacterium]